MPRRLFSSYSRCAVFFRFQISITMVSTEVYSRNTLLRTAFPAWKRQRGRSVTVYLSIGIGMALASRTRKRSNKTVVLMSDGECNEGSVWEAAMFAAAQKLEKLIAIIDFNKWQATGRSREVMALDPFKEKWQAFGWSVYEVDGHDIEALADLFPKWPDGSGKPVAIIAHTIKGKGVSFMEDNNNWHYRTPKPDEVEAAKKELGLSGS